MLNHKNEVVPRKALPDGAFPGNFAMDGRDGQRVLVTCSGAEAIDSIFPL